MLENLPANSTQAAPAVLPASRSWWSGWVEPLGLFAGWRLALLLLSFAALYLMPGFDHAGTAPRIALTTGTFYERVFGIWSHWDGEWFLHIAQAGYVPGEATSPFFPLYPMLVKLVAVFTFGNYLVAGGLVSLLAGLVVFIFLYQLSCFDSGSQVASRTVFYLAAFPTSFFLAACYSESVFLAATLGAFLAARKYSNWSLAGVALALAVLSRNMGILLFLPLGWEWLSQHRTNFLSLQTGRLRLQFQWRPLFQWGTVVFVLLPLAAYGGWLIFNALTLGDPLNFVSVQSLPLWNRHPAWPWDSIGRAFQAVTRPRTGPAFREDPNIIDLAFWLLMLPLGFLAVYQTWRKALPGSYLLYLLVSLILPLASPAAKEPLLSYPRFALLGWPVLLALAQFTHRRSWLHYTYLLGAIMVGGLLFVRFANWFWVA